MVIKIGKNLPDSTFFIMGSEGLPASITTDEIFSGKRVVIFAVPGAFTRTCTKKHLPSYVRNIPAFKAKGIDHIVCIAVNDVFTLHAWGELNGVKDNSILMLSDGNAAFTKAIGMDLDASASGMGVRSHRYAMFVEDGIVKQFFVEEEPNSLKVSSGDHLLKSI